MRQKPNWLRIIILLAALVAVALTHAQAPDMPSGTDVPPAQSQEQIDDGQLYWANPRTLADHFQRHGGDFLAESPEDYARQAHALYLSREQHQIKTDADGTVRVYDAATSAFGAYDADGATKTYFKPDNGQAYFDRQPGE